MNQVAVGAMQLHPVETRAHGIFGSFSVIFNGLLDICRRHDARRCRPDLGAGRDAHIIVLTDTPAGVVPGQAAGLELRHRQHARVEDRIREAKATGLRNLPCRGFAENAAWLEAVLAGLDLVALDQLVCFADEPDLARAEIATFRYRVLHVAARLTRSARTTRLRIDNAWRWATAIATGWQRLRAAFP